MKENVSACTNPQKPETEAENPTSPNTTNEESKPVTTTTLPVCNLLEENCKPQSAEIECDLTGDQQKMDEKEKEGEERTEGNSRPDPAIISQDEGKHD